MAISIFCDFDATISVVDIGDTLFKHFGDFSTYWNEYSCGQYDIRELNRRLCASLPTDLTFDEISEFAAQMELDPYFIKFLEYCNEHQFKFTVVSDGYDAYINPFFAKYNISGFPVYCNLLKKNSDGFYPDFFGAVEACKCETASCKRNVVLNNSADEDIIIYIGDGHTDYCGAEHSDIIFAKSKLAAYCNANKIPHYPFKSFFDIKQTLENCVKNKKMKIRNQALVKRKNAFEAE
ncbi:2-hydroxy-3-keto-5-methylthiopentenyl-1-phosphate phosphatase [bioreactor metagenome]|uniref:2-hydroxy-3-keto-5-methylthiopentenyl-1-phosphate phosphatase n=1 Tax=bioreactor metagenome TaxID=1076179 RepID=A0A645EYV0_9ZZZZ